MVLSAIGNCSFNISFSSQEILQDLLNYYSEFLKSETNEATLHFGFDKLKLCFQNTQIFNFQAELLVKFKEFFKVKKYFFFHFLFLMKYLKINFNFFFSKF
jgi:hypothetical protein